VIICVPTPLNKNREPDLSYVLQTGRSIAPHLQEGTLVILESTTYPGTTEEDLRVILEENSSLNPLLSTRRSAACALASTFTWLSRRNARTQGTVRAKSTRSRRLWAVIPRPCLERAMEVYGKAIDTPVPVSSCRVAEATKLLENIFRSVNIAVVNELKLVYGAMGIDIWEVIETAKTKPFGFMPFYPGPGTGRSLYSDRSVLSHLESA